MEFFEALRKFMHAPFTPWWTRIWVIQEVTVPPSVVVTYGTISAPWEMFARAANSYVYHITECCKNVVKMLPSDQEKVVTDSCKKIISIDDLRSKQQMRFTGPESLGLLGLLRRFRDRKASDPRDKVYALLSIVQTPPGRAPMIPDYLLSERKVFCQAAIESIYTTESLSMFSTELGRKFRDDLPSWVPDWGAPGGHTYTARADATTLYNASLEKATPDTVVLIDDSALKLRATRLTTVNVVGKVMLGDDVHYSRQTLQSWWPLWHEATTAGGRFGEPRLSDFATFLCADVLHDDNGMRRVVRKIRGFDAPTFESWAKYSRISPVGEPDDGDGVDDQSAWAGLWKEFVLLWSRDPPPSSADDTQNNRDQYFPDYINGCGADVQLITKEIAWLSFKLLEVGHTGIDPSDRHDLHRFLTFLEDFPWKSVFLLVQSLLRGHFGPDINPDIDARKSIIPDIDNSIGVASVSRCLIIGKGFTGLGPATTAVGDEVFVLTGGKTPFVLRRHEDTDENVPGPKYEIIGDCYVQGWMDGEAEQPGICEWEDITLV
jgi:hypothetical protein